MRDPDYIAILENRACRRRGSTCHLRQLCRDVLEGTLAREGRTFRVFRANAGELPAIDDDRLKGRR